MRGIESLHKISGEDPHPESRKSQVKSIRMEKKMHLVSNKLLKYVLDLKIKAAGQGRKATYTATRLLCQFYISFNSNFIISMV